MAFANDRNVPVVFDIVVADNPSPTDDIDNTMTVTPTHIATIEMPTAPAEMFEPTHINFVAASNGSSDASLSASPHGALLPTGFSNVPRRSQRHHHPSSYLHDFHCNLLQSSRSNLLQSNTSHPIEKFLSYDIFTSAQHHFLLAVSTEFEPSFFHQAVHIPHWKQAMDEEIAAMERTRTWSLMPFPHGHHAIGCKWVYRIKYNPDGSVNRYKACLVAKGYNQLEGINFLDTYFLVVKIVTVKVFSKLFLLLLLGH